MDADHDGIMVFGNTGLDLYNSSTGGSYLSFNRPGSAEIKGWYNFTLSK